MKQLRRKKASEFPHKGWHCFDMFAVFGCEQAFSLLLQQLICYNL